MTDGFLNDLFIGCILEAMHFVAVHKFGTDFAVCERDSHRNKATTKVTVKGLCNFYMMCICHFTIHSVLIARPQVDACKTGILQSWSCL